MKNAAASTDTNAPSPAEHPPLELPTPVLPVSGAVAVALITGEYVLPASKYAATLTLLFAGTVVIMSPSSLRNIAFFS